MSFHTFEIRCQLSNWQRNLLEQSFHQYAKKTGTAFYEEKNTLDYGLLNSDLFSNGEDDGEVIMQRILCSFALQDKGIMIRLVETYGSIFSNFGIWCRVNPSRMMSNKFVEVFQSECVEEMLYILQGHLLEIDVINMPFIERFKLYRLDFAINHRFPNPDIAEKFIQLMHRIRVPSGFKMRLFNDTKAKKYKLSDNGIKLYRETYSVAIYNKELQMREQEDYVFPDIEDAAGIIRFEIQCGYDKLYSIAKKGAIKDITTFLMQSDDIALYLFKFHFGIIFGEGDFYTYEYVQEKIKNADSFTKETKKRMLQLAEETSTHKNLGDAVKRLKVEYGDSSVENLLSNFDKINVNAITIPKRWNIEKILNPFKIAMEELTMAR